MIISCWVVPGASRSELKGRHGETLRIRVAAPAEAGRANREACRMLEQALGGKAEILSGGASREKRILVRGVDRPGAEAALGG